jgi:hypothetical protein
MVKELTLAIKQRMEERGWQQIHLQREVWPLIPDNFRHLLHPDGPITLQKFAEDYLLYYDVVMVDEQLGGRWEMVPYLVLRNLKRRQCDYCKYWKPHMWKGCFKGVACQYKHSLSPSAGP